MKIRNYIRDRIFIILMYFVMIALTELFLRACRVQFFLMIIILVILLLFGFGMFSYDLVRRKAFYDHFCKMLDELDRKYLITEVVNAPDFLEGKLLVSSLYEIDRSMNENIGDYKKRIESLKDYIELWIHEVKIPLAGLRLSVYNHKSEEQQSLLEQIKRIENYVEQVLYYERSENPQKDYIIRECNLQPIIQNVAKKNKEGFIYNKISLKLGEVDRTVITDNKWLEFILNQIVSNSIKYIGDGEKVIKIDTVCEQNRIRLVVTDSGIGIPKADLSRIFEHSFTGQNGHRESTSTGMGLYICKQLCDKLGHRIAIESEEGSYTKVSIVFPQNDYYNILKKES